MTRGKLERVRIKNPYLFLLQKSNGNIKRFRVNIKIYNALKYFEFFDKNFYFKKYPKIKKSGMDPLVHYILFGIRECKIPSNKFEKLYNTLKDFEYFDENYY